MAISVGEELMRKTRHAREPEGPNAKRRQSIEERIELKAAEISDVLNQLCKRQRSKEKPLENECSDHAEAQRLTVASILNCYHQRYIRSDNNPLHVWAAIAVCTNSNFGQTLLPPWCADYLRQIADTVLSIDARLAPEEGEPTEKGRFERAANEAARAFGFTPGRGRNAFKSAASDRKKINLALAFDKYRLEGNTVEAAYLAAATECEVGDSAAGTDADYAKKLVTGGKSQLRRAPAAKAGK